jgi:SAM-dependent methyltransferase
MSSGRAPQNKYDEPAFFAAYSSMPRSVAGLDAALEWHAFRALLPDLSARRVLDLGCGFGWHCRYARQQGAASVVGVYLSSRMLARARELTADPAIAYRRAAIEEISFLAGTFDVVISSLALHYVERFDLACRAVHHCLSTTGAFVLSVEHPIFTARAEQDWCHGPDGRRLHWPVDHYQQEGPRQTSWLADDVRKHHRTVATYLNTLIDAGFQVARLAEPQPPDAMLGAHPDAPDELRRPMFLLILAVKA